MIDSEMIKRLALAANGGTSFANEYARINMERTVVKMLFALNVDDLNKIRNELEHHLMYKD